METYLLLGALVYFVWENRSMAANIPDDLRAAQRTARTQWPKKRLIVELESIANSLDLYPELLWAMCDVESGWDAGAMNLRGPDGARGGAFGPLQMTLKTAQSFASSVGRTTITAVDLLDIELNLQICRLLLKELHGSGDTKRKQRDVASMWNSGKPLDAAPATTQAYVRKVRALMDTYSQRPPEA